jgi:hypothetical protein
VAPLEIDPEPLRQIKDVAPGMAVPFGELGHQLLDAGGGHGDDVLLVTLPERDFFAEGAFEHRLEVRHERGCFPSGAQGVATLARLELKLLRRAARTDAVIVVGRTGVRSVTWIPGRLPIFSGRTRHRSFSMIFTGVGGVIRAASAAI